MAAGQPAAVRVGEPVRHDGAESLGGEAFVPPLPADAVARLPDAVGQVQPRPLSFLLRLPRQGIVQADGAEHLSGGLFHHGPLVIVRVGVEQCPRGQQLPGFGGAFVGLPAQIAGHLRVAGPVGVHLRCILRQQAAQEQLRRFDVLCAGMAHGTSLPHSIKYA